MRCDRAALLLAASTLTLTACVEEPFPFPDEVETLRQMAHLGAPPADPTNAVLLDPRAQALGLALFEDPSLSACGTVSCKSCHVPEQGYTYNLGAGAPGCTGEETPRNPPSLLNVAHNTWFMWDGRADRLWSQAMLPYLNPGEMAGTPEILRNRLASAPYAADYEALFGAAAETHSDDQLLVNFGKAMQAYEWTLSKTTSPFDRDLESYLDAVEAGTQEVHPLHLALKTFVRKGECAVCHKGPTLSDQAFHNIGVADATDGASGRLSGAETVVAWAFNAESAFADTSFGPAANRIANLRTLLADPAARAEADALGQLTGAFKTPTLRNVALTAPYMHTGAVATLADVIEFYDRGGDPADSFPGTRAQNVKALELTVEEKAALVDLLERMTAD